MSHLYRRPLRERDLDPLFFFSDRAGGGGERDPDPAFFFFTGERERESFFFPPPDFFFFGGERDREELPALLLGEGAFLLFLSGFFRLGDGELDAASSFRRSLDFAFGERPRFRALEGDFDLDRPPPRFLAEATGEGEGLAAAFRFFSFRSLSAPDREIFFLTERERERLLAERERERFLAERERERFFAERERERFLAERERDRFFADRDRGRFLAERERERFLAERERERLLGGGDEWGRRRRSPDRLLKHFHF
jgi:hypothetical protein